MTADREALRRAGAVLALLAGLAAGVPARAAPEGGPEREPPRPPERPAELMPPAPAGEPLRAPPVPPERPPELTPAAPAAPGPAAEPPLPPPRPPELSGEAALALTVAAPDDTACRRRLERLGVAFEPLPPIGNGQCGAPLPLRITALGDGVALPQAATLTCVAAEALARWSTEVQAAAERTLKQPLRAITVGTSYACRGQNHDVDAKLSEHAFANGIDVASFTVEGRPPIPVAPMPPDSPEGRFLDAVRARACDLFRTVLGPGSNAAHAGHLHLDERARGGGQRLCE